MTTAQIQDNATRSPGGKLHTLFQPYRLNDTLTLPNRVLMAPMTRSMSDDHLVPTADTVAYYARRADAGLIITEGTIINREAQGYPNTPGIFTAAQIEGWRRVTEALHARGGRIFNQIWHVGRLSHPIYQPEGREPLAPSAIGASGHMSRSDLESGQARAASEADIRRTIDDFANAATNARFAGFDGVEIHGANGYLIEQFLRGSTNQRSDAYGGSIANRARFALEVVEAVAERIGSQRVGVRLSAGAYHHIEAGDGDAEVYQHVLEELNRRDLAYVHVGVFDDSAPFDHLGDLTSGQFMRRHYRGTLVGNGSYTPANAAEAISAGRFDLIAIGRPFIANPDLIARLRGGQPLVQYDNAMLARLY